MVKWCTYRGTTEMDKEELMTGKAQASEAIK